MRLAGGLLALLSAGAWAVFHGDEVALAQLRHVSHERHDDGLAALAAGSDEGAWLRGPVEGRKANASHKLTHPAFKHKYGFYLHTFGQPLACVNLLRSVRRAYPEEPVYISSDGGKNFSGICSEIGNCNFQWNPPANDRWNPLPFFNRFKDAARWLGTEFVVMLEPDNEVRWRVRSDPQDDAGGVRDSNNSALKPALLEYITLQGRKNSGNPNFEVKWPHYGLCGGSYFRTEAVLDAFDATSIDWTKLRQMDGKRVFSSDVAMALALAIHGYSYYPWSEVTQKRYGLMPEAGFRHYGPDEGKKPSYGRVLLSRDTGLVTSPDFRVGSVECQGCVWVPDAECWEHTPVRCPNTTQSTPPAAWRR